MKGCCCTEGSWVGDLVELPDGGLSSSSECERLCNSAVGLSGDSVDKSVSPMTAGWALELRIRDLGCFLNCATVTAVMMRAVSDTANMPTSMRKLRNTSATGGPEYNVSFPLPNLQMEEKTWSPM